MNLFELFVKVGVDDQASGKLKDLGSKLGNGLKTAAKIGTAAVAAAAAGITALTTASVKNYAEYEQLVGGVDTLFEKSSKKVQKYASDAYKTAGMSANDYMSTVTSFSASLLQSLGGDTDKAAEYANQALIDMSDNANKMGTSVEMIQNAYQGFAKQNYTMLDNLKLGYGGTATEMARLINDSGVLGDKMIDLGDKQNIGAALAEVGFAKMTEAIHVIQTEMGITGTTALEAGRTISGSVGSMKAAWENLLTGLADGNADIEGLVGNLVTSIVGDGTENNLGVLGNVMPAVKTALNGAAKLVSELLPAIVEQVPGIINENLPILAQAVISVIESLVDGISQNQETLMKTAIDTIVFLAESIISMLPDIVKLGLDLIVSLALGIADALPELIPTIIDVIKQIVQTLTEPKTLNKLLSAALEIIIALADGLGDAIPQLVDTIVMLIENIVVFLTDPNNLAKLVNAAIKIIISLGSGIIAAIPRLLTSFGTLITKIADNFKNTDWEEVGQNVIAGIKEGLEKAWERLETWFTGAWDGLVGGVKKLLGIHSPSRVFAEIGKNMALGIGEGWDDEFGDIEKGINSSMYFDDATFGVSSYSGGGMLGGFGGTTFGTVNINIEGYNAQDDDELAEMIAEKLQIMKERRGAVFA